MSIEWTETYEQTERCYIRVYGHDRGFIRDATSADLLSALRANPELMAEVLRGLDGEALSSAGFVRAEEYRQIMGELRDARERNRDDIGSVARVVKMLERWDPAAREHLVRVISERWPEVLDRHLDSVRDLHWAAEQRAWKAEAALSAAIRERDEARESLGAEVACRKNSEAMMIAKSDEVDRLTRALSDAERAAGAMRKVVDAALAWENGTGLMCRRGSYHSDALAFWDAVIAYRKDAAPPPEATSGETTDRAMQCGAVYKDGQRCVKRADHDGWHQDRNGLQTVQWEDAPTRSDDAKGDDDPPGFGSCRDIPGLAEYVAENLKRDVPPEVTGRRVSHAPKCAVLYDRECGVCTCGAEERDAEVVQHENGCPNAEVLAKGETT